MAFTKIQVTLLCQHKRNKSLRSFGNNGRQDDPKSTLFRRGLLMTLFVSVTALSLVNFGLVQAQLLSHYIKFDSYIESPYLRRPSYNTQARAVSFSSTTSHETDESLPQAASSDDFSVVGTRRDLYESTVTVKAKGVPLDGVWPMMVVRVNGVVATPNVVTVSNEKNQLFTFTSNAVTSQSIVDVVFINEKWKTPEDGGKKQFRLLCITSITVDGKTYSSKDSDVSFDKGTGGAAFDGKKTRNGRKWLRKNGALRFPVTFAGEASPEPTAAPSLPPTAMPTPEPTATPTPQPTPQSTSASTPESTSQRAVGLTVSAKGEPADGIWPQMIVRVNGVVASPSMVDVTNTDYQDFAFTSEEFTPTSTVEVVFVNDAWVKETQEDRNLIVESISVDGNTYPSTGPGVVIDKGSNDEAFDDVDVIPGQEKLWWDAALRFTVTYGDNGGNDDDDSNTLIVRAKGTFAAGGWPEMVVRVNGQPADPPFVIVDNISFEDFKFKAPNMGDQPIVQVAYTNDAYQNNGPGGADNRDRNLYIDSIVVNEMRIQTDDERVIVDWGEGEKAFDGIDTGPGLWGLKSPGALQFHAYYVPEPMYVPLPRLEGEVIYEQDFASGSIDAENWEIYDGERQAGWGVRRPSAMKVVNLPGAKAGKVLKLTAEMGEGADSSRIVCGGMALKTKYQTFGRYTVRVRTDKDPDRVTTGVALLWPVKGKWPDDGEIDFYEGWRDRNSRTPIDLTNHYGVDGVHDQERRYLEDSNGDWVDGSEWHTYELDWRPDYVAVKVDGGPANIVTTDPSKIPQGVMKLAIQIDVWPAPYNPGFEPSISQPVSMWVDWIKVESYPNL